MKVSQERILINPGYVSSLLGPLALAVAMDSRGDIFGLVDYSDVSQCALVIFHLIRPEFDVLDEATRQEVKKALGYLVENSVSSSSIIDSILTQCEVCPEAHGIFINELWVSIFPAESSIEYVAEKCKVGRNPLNFRQYNHSRPAELSLQDRMNKLYEMLLINFDRKVDAEGRGTGEGDTI
ncbi:hypothetical protein [Streptomyces misionensis]|uniref:hypothetical protein n=1 Tax=Streptomyces misionensis TaxID=67331 RepID=UPI0036797DF6